MCDVVKMAIGGTGVAIGRLASDARLPLPELCVRALEQRREVEAAFRASAAAWHETGLVLTTPLGTANDPRNFQRAFKARAVAAGVPEVALHSTRKACASLLVALDVHPRVAMAILRHSQIAVTMDIYSQVASASTTEALRRLSEQLDGRVAP